MSRLRDALFWIILFSMLCAGIYLVTKPQTHVYYIPHPDDEVLSFGADILNQVGKGHKVILVLLTMGEAVGSSEDRDIIAEARQREFESACQIMGVQWSYKHLPDAGVEVDSVRRIIAAYDKRYINAYHKTYDYEHDYHPDHLAAGQALLESNVSNKTFFVAPWNRVEGLTEIRTKHIGTWRNALQAYCVICEGRYAIGYQSVNEYFENQLREMVVFTR